MVRLAALGVALLVFPAMSFAQTSTGRVLQDAVILDQPRGDSRVLATVPPGVVLELLALQGDWYSVPVPGATRGRGGATGWINRLVVEPLPGRVPAQPAGAPTAASTDLQPPRGPVFYSRQGIRPHSTEVSVQGGFSTTNYGGGVTTSTFAVDGLGAYFITQAVEVGVLASLFKATDRDPIGQIGGAAAYNIAPDKPFNAFVGGAFGRQWFGLSGLNPNFVEVFEIGRAHV